VKIVMRAWSALVVIGCFVAAPGAARADDGFRCGSRVVSKGDSIAMVRKRCGEPTDIQRRTELRRVVREFGAYGNGTFGGGKHEDTVEVQIQVWTYDPGAHRLMRYATFIDGVLDSTSEGDRSQ
jgi:hypothetical protein